MALPLFRNSIVKRWTVGVLSIVTLTVFAAAVAFCFFIRVYNYRALVAAVPEYVSSFEQLSHANSDEYWNTAVNLTENFENMDKVKVTVFNSNGIVIASTDGFTESVDVEELPDYAAALTAENGIGSWQGRDPVTGESIAATTVAVKNSSDTLLGAYRYVVSLRVFNGAMIRYYIIVAGVGAIMITLVLISGLYFVSSIVKPVRQVTGVARKIAMGDLSARLEPKSSDEIGELCDAINYMASELGKTETLKNDFLSSVSHELRTPLTAIRGWGETVSMAIGSDDDTVRRGIDVILSETGRLSNLVEELLDFSRLQSGSFKVNMQPTDILSVVDEAVNMYEEIARKQGIAMTYFPLTVSVCVKADRDRLKQVFINIIDNAVKYTNSGGQIIVSAVMDDNCIRIIVQDTGVGIPKRDVDHVKERFYKANKTVRGSGIGLAVADEIIKQHNGLLLVESTENVGTAVTVVLPIYDENKPTEGNADEAAANKSTADKSTAEKTAGEKTEADKTEAEKTAAEKNKIDEKKSDEDKTGVEDSSEEGLLLKDRPSVGEGEDRQ